MEYNLQKKTLNHYIVQLKPTEYCKSTILQLKKQTKNPQTYILNIEFFTPLIEDLQKSLAY